MNVELVGELRSGTGEGAARRLRREDKVPGVLYGPKTEPVSVSVMARQFEMLLRGLGEETRLIQFILDDGGEKRTRQVLIREIQKHPVRRRFLHVDFYEAPLDQPIVVVVPVELTGVGDCVGIRKGGALDLLRRTLSVKCLPSEIPERVPVDVSALDLNVSVHVGDLVGKIPFELMDDRHHSIVQVLAPEGAGAAEN